MPSGGGWLLLNFFGLSRNRVVDVFRRVGATTVERAQSLAALGIAHEPAIRQLQEEGILRPAQLDRYYLDEARHGA